jgi:hypothetical protein
VISPVRSLSVTSIRRLSEFMKQAKAHSVRSFSSPLNGVRLGGKKLGGEGGEGKAREARQATESREAREARDVREAREARERRGIRGRLGR